MAHAGQIITDPIIGDRIVFIATARETHGERVTFDDFLLPGALGPPEHVHTNQEEHLAVIKGTMHVQVAGHEQMLRAGESIAIPPGTPHIWDNAGEDELQVRTEFRPAREVETFFETLFGLARDGKVNAKGDPAFLQIALLSPKHGMYLSKPPIPIQKALFAILGPIAKLCGYRTTYPQYSDVSVDEESSVTGIDSHNGMRESDNHPT